MTLKERKEGYVEAYQRIVDRCVRQGLEVPTVNTVSVWMGINYKLLITCLTRADIKFTRGDQRKGSSKGSSIEIPAEMA